MRNITCLLFAAGLMLAACGGEDPNDNLSSDPNSVKTNCSAIKTEAACLASKVCDWEATPACPAIYPPVPCNSFCYDPAADPGNDCSTVSSNGTVTSGTCPPSGSGGSSTAPGSGGSSTLPGSP
jgi:hypothetical protein